MNKNTKMICSYTNERIVRVVAKSKNGLISNQLYLIQLPEVKELCYNRTKDNIRNRLACLMAKNEFRRRDFSEYNVIEVTVIR